MRIPSPPVVDAAVALGLLLIAAIDHLTASSFCCPACCPACAALDFYQNTQIADTATALALAGQHPTWQMADEMINWPYLNQFWNAPSEHACHDDNSPAV